MIARIVAIRNYLLAAAAVAVVCAIPISEELTFDQRLESFFADDNPDIVLLKQSRKDFGGDEFVIVAWSEPQLFVLPEGMTDPDLKTLLSDKTYLPELEESVASRIRNFADTLSDIPGVNGEKTQDLESFLKQAIRSRNTRRGMLRLFEGTLVGPDAKTTGIILELIPETSSTVSRAETLSRIRAVSHGFNPDVAVAGEPVQVFDMFQLVEEDGGFLFIVALMVLAAVLLLMFRGLRWVLAPVGIVLGSVVATRAILVLIGSEMSMVSSMLNSLVTVIGIATCMHVIVHYRDLRLERDPTGSADRTGIAIQTLTDLAGPVFWTCLTTAVGFGSLLVSQITPVRSFSIMMCLATGVVFFGCFAVLPATLASGSRLNRPTQVPLEHWLDKILDRTCLGLERFPRQTALVCGVLILGAAPGVFMLTLETQFSKNFRKSSSIVQALEFIESRLGGAGTWEVAFDTPRELSKEFLDDIARLTEGIRTRPGVSDLQVLSLTDAIDLPPTIGSPQNRLRRIENRHPDLVHGFYNQPSDRMRIVLRSREQQNSESKQATIAAVRQRVNEFFTNHSENSDATASGMFVLLTEVVLSLLEDQRNSFIWACLGILICMTVAFRSLRIGLISMVPNIFPVAIVIGVLGWLQVPVNMGTAMITSVSLGLTVDSTIHYITAFERARKTNSIPAALRIAHAGAGRAVVLAHFALVAGFLVLTASRFIPLVYFGALLSLSMIGGVFGDLVLLPLLLRWTTPTSSATTVTEIHESAAAATVEEVEVPVP